MIFIENKRIDRNCILCESYFRHSIRFYKPKDEVAKELKEVDIITHCAYCRTLLRKIKETKKKLNELETDMEYFLFIKDI